jgi:hypothetical protein
MVVLFFFRDSKWLEHTVLPFELTPCRHFAIIEIKKNFFIFFSICCYAPAEQPPPKMAETNKVVANNKPVK